MPLLGRLAAPLGRLDLVLGCALAGCKRRTQVELCISMPLLGR
eukprot:CAMPEP_0171947886 /NCGR_PEP_ID=MMETSP0993-20121228/62549_1 /TAXON_ID=483369 /ORGANISM="non described non described, Strain CCMP2098" /LENGTH=42 /DNA_ID= /DNA_START= /DNA_END= /DNA_ORIENTATION=